MYLFGIMVNQMEKKIENDMETRDSGVVHRGYIGIMEKKTDCQH